MTLEGENQILDVTVGEESFPHEAEQFLAEGLTGATADIAQGGRCYLEQIREVRGLPAVIEDQVTQDLGLTPTASGNAAEHDPGDICDDLLAETLEGSGISATVRHGVEHTNVGEPSLRLPALRVLRA